MAVKENKKGRLSFRQRMALRLLTTNERAAVTSIGDVPPTMVDSRISTKQPLTNPYKQHPTVHACVSFLGKNVAQVPFYIYKGTDNRSRQRFERERITTRDGITQYRTREQFKRDGVEVVEEGALATLFDQPNTAQSSDQFWEMVVIHLTYSGECDIINLERSNITSIPKELWPMSPKLFDTRPIGSARPLSWLFNPGPSSRGITAQRMFAPYEITVPHTSNPDSFIRGLSPVDVAEMGLQMDWNARLYNSAFFNNDASGGGYFITNHPMQKTQREEWIIDWNRQHMGATKAFKWALLDNIKEVVPTTLKPKDVQFPTLSKMNKEEVAMIWGLPLALLSNTETLPNAKDKVERRGVWMTTLIPIMKHLESVFYSELFKWVEGGKYWGAFDLASVDALQEDFDVKLNQGKKLFDMRVPFNMVNERLGLGFEDVPGGDLVLVPANLIDINDIGSLPPEGDGGQADHTETYMEEERITDPEKFVNLQARWIKKFADHYHKYLFDFRKAVLKRTDYVFKRSDCDDIIDYILANEKRWDELLIHSSQSIYIASAADAIKITAKELGVSPFTITTSPETMKAMERRLIRLANTNKYMRDQLHKTMAESLYSGDTVSELQRKIKDNLNFQSARSLTIARTEMNGITGDARFTQMGEAGVDKSKWRTAGAGATPTPRVHHLEAERMGAIPLGEIFGNTGCRYPGDQMGAAGEVINCRCVQIPVVNRVYAVNISGRKKDPDTICQGVKKIPKASLPPGTVPKN